MIARHPLSTASWPGLAPAIPSRFGVRAKWRMAGTKTGHDDWVSAEQCRR